MAEQWALDLIKNAKAGKTQQTQSFAQPTPQTTRQPIATATPAPAPKVSTKPSVGNPHGKLFDGGIVSRGLDLLRLPEYAATSFAKGNRDKLDQLYKGKPKGTYTAGQNVSNLLEGVKSGVANILPGTEKRTQLGREEGDYNMGRDITKNDKVQTAINFGTSLALPTAPVGKILGTGSKVVSKVPGVEKVSQTTQKLVTPVVDYAKSNQKVYNTVEKIPGLEHFRNPEAGKVITQATDVTARRVSSLYNKINDTAKGLTKAEREEISAIIEGKVVSSSTKLNTRANYIRQISDDIGREVVDSGLMSEASFAKFKGKYISHIADVVKKEDAMSRTKKLLSYTSDSLKQRKDILGSPGKPDYIKEFQFPTFKALSGEIQNVESVKAVRQLADKFGTKVSTSMRKAVKSGEVVKNFHAPRTLADGKVLLSDILGPKVGRQFKGIAVPQEIADYIMKKSATNKPGIAEQLASKSLNAWKLGKTVYSGPGYHARNLMSNQILSDYSTNAGIPRTLAGYAKAVRAYMGKGDSKMNQYIAEAKDSGLLGRMDISGGVENMKPSVFGQGQSKLSKVVNAPKKFQQASEETAKLNVFSFWRNKGLSVKEATKKAEEAIFSPYNINPNERAALKNVVPFYSFTRQALPQVVKTGLNKGNTLTKYEKAKTAIEGLSPEGAANNSKLPENMKGQIRLPIKDKKGNYSYFDPSYINPAGNFDSNAGGTLPFGMSLNPLLTEAASQLYNKDLYFDQPIAKSNIPERAKAQRIQHALQTFAPNMLPTDAVGGVPSGQAGINYKTRGGSKLFDAFTGQKDYAGRTRSKIQAVLDTFGLKSSVFEPDVQQKFDNVDKAKALKAIQTERRSVSLDKRLSAKEKSEIMKQLSTATRNLLIN